MEELHGLGFFSKGTSEISENLLHDMLNKVCHGTKLSYANYSTLWMFEEWLEMFGSVQLLLHRCQADNCTEAVIQEASSLLPEVARSAFSRVLSMRADELLTSARRAAVQNTTNSFLSDFDWQVKLCMSSDRAADLQLPVTALQLHVSDATGTSRVQHVEMDQDEMQELVSALRAASQAASSMK